MIKYICTNCNYKFESENASGCPYCGSDKFEKDKSAQELLEEIGDILKNE